MEEGWRVSSLRYEYAIEVSSTNQEVVAFHWPGHGVGEVPFAHVHLGHANSVNAPFIGPKAHIPTGRVAIEDIIYFIIKELQVRPRTEDWQEILAEVRKPFMEHKTW